MFKFSVHHPLILGLVLVAFCAAFYKAANHSTSASFRPSAFTPQATDNIPGMHTHFASTRQHIHVHAASLVELGDGRIRAFWFAGSREGAEDVEIMSAVFDPSKNTWDSEQSVANRSGTEHSLFRYVRKLGNPVALRGTDGKLWLFYVTVSLGGWAGSSITAITSTDEGTTWSLPRRLITSPFLNISTLVKGTPFLYEDGTIGLPVYHEFIGKFGELLRISNAGEIIDKQRLSVGKTTLQPIVLIKDPQHALVLMRYSGASPKRVVATSTEDGGQHWEFPYKTALANPDAAISGVTLSDGRILVALNNTEQGRDVLSLVISADGGTTWQTVYQFEDQHDASVEPQSYVKTASDLAKITDTSIIDTAGYGESAKQNKCGGQHCSFEFSYPYLIRTQAGDFHLVYTWNRSFIKHIRFSRAWLDQQIKNDNSKLH